MAYWPETEFAAANSNPATPKHRKFFILTHALVASYQTAGLTPADRVIIAATPVTKSPPRICHHPSAPGRKQR